MHVCVINTFFLCGVVAFRDQCPEIWVRVLCRALNTKRQRLRERRRKGNRERASAGVKVGLKVRLHGALRCVCVLLFGMPHHNTMPTMSQKEKRKEKRAISWCFGHRGLAPVVGRSTSFLPPPQAIYWQNIACPIHASVLCFTCAHFWQGVCKLIRINRRVPGWSPGRTTFCRTDA